MLYGEKYALIYVKKKNMTKIIYSTFKEKFILKGKVSLWGIANLSSVLWQNEVNDKKFLCPWDETPKNLDK